MLSLQTVLPNTLELLKTIIGLPPFSQTRLVGGTALALQYGHRQSVDLDFFAFVDEDTEELTEILRESVEHLVRGNCTKRIRTYMLNDIKVDIVTYDYPWIDEPIIEDGIRLASPKDIAAMIVNAIVGRGTKKDFIDIYFLMQHFSFEELMQFYLKKYAEGSEYRALLSMTYFDDAEPQPMPLMYKNVSWSMIKCAIKKAVEDYNKKHL